MTLAELNAAPEAACASFLDGVFEHAPWVAAAAARRRPFATVEALHAALLGSLRDLPQNSLVAFFCGHPELAGDAARDGAMTAASVDEQATLDLAKVGGAEAAEWNRLNAAYRKKFGFPFILCVRRHTRHSALRTFERRLEYDRETELASALSEVGHISRLRLDSRFK